MVLDTDIQTNKNEIAWMKIIHADKMRTQANTFEKELNYLEFELMTTIKTVKLQFLVLKDKARQLISLRNELEITNDLLLESRKHNSVQNETITRISLELSIKNDEISAMVLRLNHTNEDIILELQQ